MTYLTTTCFESVETDLWAVAITNSWIFCCKEQTQLSLSTLLQKHCNKKQETEEGILKICGYIYHHGTYTHQAGTNKRAGLFYRLPVLRICS